MASTVLVLTALEDVTADWVIAALNEREVPVVRADPADIGLGLSFGARIGAGASAWAGHLVTGSREVELGEVAAVYYRRPTPYAARFDHLPAQQRDFAATEARHGLGGVLSHLHGAYYVNHPGAVTAADFKPAQLQLAVRLGLTVPPTLITNDAEQAADFAAVHGPVIYKTFRGLPRDEDGHTGAIWAQRVDAGTFDDSLAVTAHLFQAEIPKTADVRVTVVGKNVSAQQIAAPDGALDWRRGDWDQLLHAPVAVPSAIEAALHSYLAAFGLVFGCFDFALTGDGDAAEDWVFIECNPNGQWGWLPDADDITTAFADILSRATEGDGAR
ncbi:ATP-grasp ribosomal peptide maturase [Streptomyces cyaneofuscatus]|uniref:ATP-grasp ribosomal peptide maturase n=1 Tax=Streptomyces cyaneofuscatus TaxID=66883 RepID=UPI002D765BAA|nr:ATP-grasp ribosomal peptide maturase [Streptomyces cyaneofuscatus]WRO12680.1 ATP-grasp ribosomal peptide maturase [Streptomyces cyaneofuscatus]